MARQHPLVALAPIRYYDLTKTHNLEKIRRFIRRAKRAHADIVCFPESCLHKTQTLTLQHRIILQIREECRRQAIWCIVTEDLRRRGRRYNTALLIDREGKVRGHYEKIHLCGDTNTRPGTRVPVFQTDFGRVGIAICWDLAFPEIFRQLRRAKADIIFCPSQWWYEPRAHERAPQAQEKRLLRSLIMTRAFENLCFVAVCNPIMASKYQVSYSAITSPHRVLAELQDKEGLLTAQLDFKKLRKWRKLYT